MSEGAQDESLAGIDLRLEQFDIPEYSKKVLLSALATFDRDQIGLRSRLTAGYVSISAAGGGPVALYIHKTMVSIALDPEDAAFWLSQFPMYLRLDHNEQNHSTRHVRISHTAIRVHADVATHLFVNAVEVSLNRAKDQSPIGADDLGQDERRADPQQRIVVAPQAPVPSALGSMSNHQPWTMVHLWLDGSESRVVTVSLARQDELLLVNPPTLPNDTLHARVTAGVREWRPFGSTEAPELRELEVLRVVMGLDGARAWKRLHQPELLAAASRSGQDRLAGLLELLATLTDDRSVTLYNYPSGRRWEETLPFPDPSAFVRLSDACTAGHLDEALQWLVSRGLQRNPSLEAQVTRRLDADLPLDAASSDRPADHFDLNSLDDFEDTVRTEAVTGDQLNSGGVDGPSPGSGAPTRRSAGAGSAELRDLYLAASPEDQLQLLPLTGMPGDVLSEVVRGKADPALVTAALANPACSEQLLIVALRDPDATVRLEALETLQTRQVSAPVEALRDAMRLPVRGRPSRLQEVLEFSPQLVPDLARALLARPSERAEAEASLMEVHEALRTDLMYAMSRSAQELFHSNTWAWLTENSSDAAKALLRLFGSGLDQGSDVEVWREHHHLDLLLDPGERHPKVVIENKLFSVPGPGQLRRYSSTPLPWSDSHGETGAENTRYILLSLLPPSFALPKPWSHIGYDQLSNVIDSIIGQLASEGRTLLTAYAQLLRQLSRFAKEVDPRLRPDESFYNWQPDGIDLAQGQFSGIVHKLRFSGLVQMVQEQLHGPAMDFEVNITRGTGLASFHHAISPTRIIGWQLQGNQFRLFVRISDDGLHGRGSALKEERAHAAAESHAPWFNFSAAEDRLGPFLRPRAPHAKVFLHFDPDFVYQTRTLDPSVRTSELAKLLADYTTYALGMG